MWKPSRLRVLEPGISLSVLCKINVNFSVHKLCHEHQICMDGTCSPENAAPNTVSDRKDVFFYQSDDDHYVPRALVSVYQSAVHMTHFELAARSGAACGQFHTKFLSANVV